MRLCGGVLSEGTGMELRELYIANKETVNSCPDTGNYLSHLKVLKCTPKYFGLKSSLLWNVATLGQVKIYAIFDGGGMIIHSSYVVKGRQKFSFLGKEDIEIGPCQTKAEHRGKGIYPLVLCEIVKHELSESGNAFMIVKDNNQASIRGVTKAGFQKTGDKIRVGRLKRYYICDG